VHHCHLAQIGYKGSFKVWFGPGRRASTSLTNAVTSDKPTELPYLSKRETTVDASCKHFTITSFG